MDMNYISILGALVFICGMVITTLMVIEPGAQSLAAGAGGGIAGLGILIMFRSDHED